MSATLPGDAVRHAGCTPPDQPSAPRPAAPDGPPAAPRRGARAHRPADPGADAPARGARGRGGGPARVAVLLRRRGGAADLPRRLDRVRAPPRGRRAPPRRDGRAAPVPPAALALRPGDR